jgi:hypothetical protein
MPVLASSMQSGHVPRQLQHTQITFLVGLKGWMQWGRDHVGDASLDQLLAIGICAAAAATQADDKCLYSVRG